VCSSDLELVRTGRDSDADSDSNPEPNRLADAGPDPGAHGYSHEGSDSQAHRATDQATDARADRSCRRGDGRAGAIADAGSNAELRDCRSETDGIPDLIRLG
jgi:hypothetical protein